MSNRSLGLALLYGLVAALWITLSDYVLSLIIEDPASITAWQTAKELGYVVVTALLLYLLLRRTARHSATVPPRTGKEQLTDPLLEKTFSSLGDAVFVVEAPSRTIVSCNNAVERIFGYRPEELIGRTTEMLHLDHDYFDRFAKDQDRALVRDGTVSIEYQLRHRDGSVIQTENTVTLLDPEHAHLNKNGKLSSGQVVSIARDVTARKRAEKQQRLATMVFENSNEAIVIGDANKRIIFTNPAFHKMTGYSQEEVFEQYASMLDAGTHDEDFYRIMWDTVDNQGHWQGEVTNRRRNGETYIAWLSISAVRDKTDHIVNYIGVATDLSEQRRLDERIRYLSFHDSVTGLLNRDAMLEHLEQAIIHARRVGRNVAVIILNIDRFKTVNDSLGHSRGDQLLQKVGRGLLSSVRAGDAVARLAADQFVVVLSELARPEDINVVIEKLSACASTPVEIDEREIFVSFSTGIAVFPRDADNAEDLVRSADAAMNEARREGGGRCRFFTDHMHEQAMERLTLEGELRRALERGELSIYYQPQVSLLDGRIAGTEALLRWYNERFGIVAPGKFIPLAEESGLIVPIGRWVLENACRQAKAWQTAGLFAGPVAVNLSARQFREARIVEWVQETLETCDLAPGLLELELTESMLMADTRKTIATMEELKKIGVRLSIDDFGTGYSSLSYLKRFPLDTLKIDRSFIRDITTDAAAAAIAESIIIMARNMGMRVIAEGVETLEQLEFLRNKGCDEAQGFFFSPAVEEKSLSPMLIEGFTLPGLEPAAGTHKTPL